MVFHVRLPRFTAEHTSELTSRSYQLTEVHAIVARQAERNQISTWLSFYSGLRAHELCTIARRAELAPSAHREWRADRFLELGVCAADRDCAS